MIGAKDRIDQLLVQKYMNLKVNNTDTTTSSMPVEKFWQLMGYVARYEKAIIEAQQAKKAV